MNEPMFHLQAGDCLRLLPALRENLVDAIVTDPPYGLKFMGRAWDHGVPGPEFWNAHLRVAKPGAHLVAFGGTRTAHRLACAIEDGGWQLRDTLMWIYGSGFPKSKNMGGGRGTALKPAWEPIILARKKPEGTATRNLAKWGTGALNVDACRIPTTVGEREWQRATARPNAETLGFAGMHKPAGFEPSELGRWPANLVHDGSDDVLACFPDAAGQLADASSSSSSRKTKRVYGTMKRGNGREGEASADSDNAGVVGFAMKPGARRGDAGSAARFFYCAKASTRERGEGNDHPTVKPLALMRWLVELITPPGGIVLDGFAGSGSTGVACASRGFRFIGMDLEQHNLDIARARILASLGRS